MRFLITVLTLVVCLTAAEYHGNVTFGGLPLPGVTITATQGDKTLTTSTDERGRYSFADLPDENWSFRAHKLGFSPEIQDVSATSLPGALIDLKVLPLDQIEAPANVQQPQASAEPAPEITTELTSRAEDGLLINGSAVNGAITQIAQSPAFGNARRKGRPLYNFALALVDSNSALDAANYSLTGQHTVKPPFNNMTGTASFGGPIRIPHLTNGDRSSFSLTYSRVENRSSSVYTGLMPDAAERAGSAIPASRISPQALALLQYYPLPNFDGGGRYNYQAPLIGNTHTDNLQVGMQKSFRQRNTVSGGITSMDTRGDSNSPFHFLDLNRSFGINANAAYRRTFTSRFYGTFTFTFSRFSNRLDPFFAGRENVSGAAGIAGNNQDPLNWGPPSLQFNQSSIAGLSDGNASVTHNQTSAIGYTSSWNHHGHNITFGGDYRRQQFNTISQSNPRGTFTFNGAATDFDFTDFLLGIPDASAIAFGNADKYLRGVQPDLFFQDDWKLSSGLTLQLGMRWEYGSPLTEKYGRLVNLSIAPGFSAIAPVVANTDPRPLIRPDDRGIEPRFGLAWRPFASSSLVVRAGYGISYNTQTYQPFANQMVQQSPLSTSLNVANTAANPLTLANGFYAPPNVATNTIAVDPNFRPGYAQVWNLVMNRDLPADMQVVATYTGTKGTHQLQAFAPNTYPTGPVGPSGYVYYTSGGNSARESGTLELRRRMHTGFAATAQYTWSKSIDDAALLGGGGLGVVAQNWLNLEAERGLSGFDQRHLANLQLQYSPGMGLGGGTLLSGWRGRLVRDWTFVDAITLGSGLPLTPVSSLLCPATGTPCSVRADYTGAPLYDAPAGAFLNPAAVTTKGPGQWGNAGRDSMTGPGQFSMSGSMSRAFRLNDRFTLNLRINASNPLNHVVVTQLNTTVTNQLFGLPLAVNPMRTLTTTMRLTF
jgi:carboxypeptidase family protein